MNIRNGATRAAQALYAHVYRGRAHPLCSTDSTLMRTPRWGTKEKCLTR